MRLVIIGTGNVATVLSHAAQQAGHDIVQVYGRDAAKAASLAASRNALPVHNIAEISSDADLYLIAVSDGAVAAVAAELNLGNKLVVHTAGSVSKDVLKVCSTNYGVLYPLQSLRAEMPGVPDIPLLIDANTGDDLALLQQIAGSISSQVQIAGDEQRLQLHVAAVIVSNFTNHLYALAEQYCQQSGLDFRMLQPLISEVADRIKHGSPKDLQTGPAIRNDHTTISRHLQLLRDFPQLNYLYEELSNSIWLMYNK
ncbi:DUF2520 domain-containing protein [Pseudoflavitalea sp. G-6-1-2]|uniref:Rossmann-like and DUF2520 domain-containing protein n=1 Tax=Pseudoflavitalea sp. G-6-1-2 TaxID=2728841 RepID=UPI00146D3E2F|nr:Rossmann-like and DUF2520 domain-containing protein [Pseudoflavitalea sp. G-6-1-2]NML23903.1 DUF2520 domain-containing protein [Pseudoflavitalea sp. G-6-1-2]